MSKIKKIVWIDDTSSRKLTADELGAEFIDVGKMDLESEINRMLHSKPPTLVVLDHILDTQAKNKNPIFQRGSTIAEMLKEKWPDCPVVGVTNAADLSIPIDLRTKRTYDVLLPFENFRKYFGDIDTINAGFLKLSKDKPSNSRDIVNFLKPPKADVLRLIDVLPEDLKNSFSDTSITSRIFEWIQRVIERPGFLYDSLWTSTLLGLNETGFKKVVTSFSGTTYNGVFATERKKRWWVGLLTERLHRLFPNSPGEMTWEIGRKLEGITKAHYSRCYVCKEPFPETVACLDEISNDRYQMHLRCTVLHPRYKRELYFDDIRMMKGQ